MFFVANASIFKNHFSLYFLMYFIIMQWNILFLYSPVIYKHFFIISVKRHGKSVMEAM